MTIIRLKGEGIVYRNPSPHVFSRHAYFPSAVTLLDGEMVAAFSVGQAFEAADLHTCIARSTDGGETWIYEGTLYPGTKNHLTSDVCRLSLGDNGEIVAFVIRHDRQRENEGLANPDNLGFVEVELLLFRSADGGRTWTGPQAIEPPLVGPSFEMTSPIVPLQDGSWLLPTSTWRGWEGYCPNGMKMVALQSFDQGRSWPSWLDVMNDERQEIIYWESKIVELQEGRLLAVAWAYHEKEARDLPNQYAIREAGQDRFSSPRSTGLQGQTLNAVQLDDGKIFTVYRRMDRPGLWANISRLENDEWVNESEQLLWSGYNVGQAVRNQNMAENFAQLKFGAPHISRLPDGSWYVVFWAIEQGVGNIRWIKLDFET